jgi:hypothetical protein
MLSGLKERTMYMRHLAPENFQGLTKCSKMYMHARRVHMGFIFENISRKSDFYMWNRPSTQE